MELEIPNNRREELLLNNCRDYAHVNMHSPLIVGYELGCKPSDRSSGLQIPNSCRDYAQKGICSIFLGGLPIPACSYKKLSISERSVNTSDDSAELSSAGRLLFTESLVLANLSR